MQNTINKPRASSMTIKLDELHRDRLKSLAVAKRRTPHYLMKEALNFYLESEEAEQNAIQEAAASLEHFERTGLHIRLDEVKQWAKELKTNRNAKLPLCHT
jgi:predicted transcriptional regulator